MSFDNCAGYFKRVCILLVIMYFSFINSGFYSSDLNSLTLLLMSTTTGMYSRCSFLFTKVSQLYWVNACLMHQELVQCGNLSLSLQMPWPLTLKNHQQWTWTMRMEDLKTGFLLMPTIIFSFIFPISCNYIQADVIVNLLYHLMIPVSQTVGTQLIFTT